MCAKPGRFVCYGPALVRGRRTRSAMRFAGISAAFVLVGVSVATAAGTGESLRRQASTLESRTHRALLDLYALDSRLHAAQARLSSLAQQSRRVRNQQALLARQISA